MRSRKGCSTPAYEHGVTIAELAARTPPVRTDVKGVISGTLKTATLPFFKNSRPVTVRKFVLITGSFTDRTAVVTRSASDVYRLLAEARRGDVAVLGELLGLYRNYLKLLAGLDVGPELQSKLDASDLVQETLLAAHHRFESFRGETEEQLTAWLRAILANRIRDLAERRFSTQKRNVRRERQIQESLDSSSSGLGVILVDGKESPSQAAARREQAVLLADILQELPDDHRKVLILRHLEQLRFEDIAEIMERSEDAVKKLWARALINVRRASANLE